MAKKDETIINKAFDFTSEKEPEITFAGKGAKRYPGWEAGEIPPATDIEKVKELPEEFKEKVEEIINKHTQLEESLKPLENALATVKSNEEILNKQIKENDW